MFISGGSTPCCEARRYANGDEEDGWLQAEVSTVEEAAIETGVENVLIQLNQAAMAAFWSN